MVTSPMTGGPTDDDLDGNDLTTESLRICVATTGTGTRGHFGTGAAVPIGPHRRSDDVQG
jgi:hypothetical protein